MAWTFEKPNDIRKFGNMINEFSKASKALAKLMSNIGMTPEETLSIVGEGHYNTLQDDKSNFIRYGKHVAQPLRGLFGGFVFAHIPEMALARRMPALLGERGFNLVVLKGSSEIGRRPLNGDDFHFAEATRNIIGQITLREAWRFTDGENIPAGTVLTSDRNARAFIQRPWRFQVQDAQGKIVNDDVSTKMLWGTLGARGMKSLGAGSIATRTLMASGTDDDFAAERAMIECMDVLIEQHNTDLMPYFNGLVRQQAIKLGNAEGQLPTLYLAAEQILSAAKVIQEASTAWTTYTRQYDYNLTYLNYVETAAFSALAECFGLTLPTTLDHMPELKNIADNARRKTADIGRNKKEELERLRRENIVPDILKVYVLHQYRILCSPTNDKDSYHHYLNINPTEKAAARCIHEYMQGMPIEEKRQVAEQLDTTLRAQAHLHVLSDLGILAQAFGHLQYIHSRKRGGNEICAEAKLATDAVTEMAKAKPQGFKIDSGLLEVMERAVTESEALFSRKAIKTSGQRSVSEIRKARSIVRALCNNDGNLEKISGRSGLFPDLLRLDFFADLRPEMMGLFDGQRRAALPAEQLVPLINFSR